MVRVKICGLRRENDVAAAIAAGADLLGFNFWQGTSRYVAPAEVRGILRNTRPQLMTVGVFVDEHPERILEIAAATGVQAVQLHGSEPPEWLERLGNLTRIKALKVTPQFRPAQLAAYSSADIFLLDGFIAGMQGGTGQTFDWSLAQQAKQHGKILLAGGLTVSNVADAVRAAQPWGVDVASGVEQEPGKKDARLIAEFIQAVRAADASSRRDAAQVSALSAAAKAPR
jgi:phosphoribosylanthranilate isomerase